MERKNHLNKCITYIEMPYNPLTSKYETISFKSEVYSLSSMHLNIF